MEATSRIYIRGLPPSLSIEDFRKHFSNLAPITDAKFIPHRRIGYVGYRSAEDAARAVKYHNKTFVRMSKIAVEFARSVEAERHLKAKLDGANHGKGDARLQKHEKDGDGSGSARHDAMEHSKMLRTKRDEAKLQEFLAVMQHASKSKSWQDQSTMPSAAEVIPAAAQKQGTPQGSHHDDEYEEVPRKRKKITNDPKTDDLVPPAPSSEVKAVPRHGDGETGTGLLEDTTSLPATTDEDWLRSRTNRVLDLIEDKSNLALNQVPGDGGEPHGVLVENQSHAPGNVESRAVDENSTTDPAVQKVEAGQDGPAHEREPQDNRLFLRNLSFMADEDAIREYFESHGCDRITEVSLGHTSIILMHDELPDRDNLCSSFDDTLGAYFSRCCFILTVKIFVANRFPLCPAADCLLDQSAARRSFRTKQRLCACRI